MAIRIKRYYLAPMLALLFGFVTLHSQTVTFTKTNVTCNGAADGTITISLSGGSSTYWYVYYKTFQPSVSDSFGPTTNLNHTFTGLDPDYYTAFVRDIVSGDVLDFNTLQITQPAVLNATVNSVNVNCYGANNGSITISSPTGGSGSYDYSISGGASWQTSGSYTGLSANTYVVMIRDRNAPSCTRVLNPGLVITQPAQLNATVSSTNVTCYGYNNGTIVISAPSGGSGSYQYSRNGGVSWQASGTFSGLAPGTYNVVMRDAATPSCTHTLNPALVITQPGQLNVNDIIIIKGLTCNEGSDGQLQAVVTGGTAPYTYGWYVNPGSGWVSIGQSTQTAINLPQGWYEVRVNDANNCGSPTPASAREFFLQGATDSIPPMFYFDSASVVNTCQGQTNGSLTLYAHGGVSPIRYSITSGGAGGYQASGSFTGLAAGNYETWAMDKKGCKKTGGTKTIGTTPNAPVSVTISANPSGAICPGTSVLFTATPVNGGTTPAYQWRLNGSPVGSGGATYSTSTLANGDQVNVVLTSSLRCTSGNPATSNTITASLLLPTAITVQPVSLAQCAGTNATFSVTATGTGLTYQWRKGGVNIGGATSSSYTLNNITPADAGSYDVVITGTCGVATSNPATLTVQTAPVITVQPVSLAQCAGTNSTFSVTATGTGLTYQWRKGGVNIGGATSSSYTLNNITPADAGSYDVVVTGTCGVATSNPATLTVQTAPAITVQPVPVTSCEGTTVTFSVTATGAGLTYQWRKNGLNIGGATAATLVLNNITPSSAGNYDVVINGTCGMTVSNTAALTVALKPQITLQPSDVEVCEGADVSFTVTATGTSLAYQWRKDGVNLPGMTSPTLDLMAVTLADAGDYDVLVYGMCDTVTSNTAVLTVNPATTVVAMDDDTLVCEGSNVDFHITANGYGAISYQWQWHYAGSWIDLSDGGDVTGTLTSTLRIQNVEAADSGYYRCYITSGCGSIYSDSVKLGVNHIVATIGTPAPFLIDSLTTGIQVGIRVTDRFLLFDLGFSLVAPDGTEVMLKGPLTFPCVFNPFNNGVDVTFSNDEPAGDTIDYCWNVKNITGTYAATGNWHVLHGKDPSNGAWQIRVYDGDKSVPDPDGFIRQATLTFTDLDYNGDTAVIIYNSGNINEDILNPIAGELRPTPYVVPIRLMTSCYNTQDARAVVTVKGGIAPYTYQWSGPSALPDDNDVMLGAGTWTVTVIDAMGCSATATVDVSSPPAIVVEDVQVSDTLKCFGETTGWIRAKASGGTGAFTYILLPGNIPSAVADSGVFTGLAAGTYTLHITDLNGCSADTLITIAQRPQLMVQVDVVPVIGANPGSITLTASGGTPPYLYSIDNGSTVQDSGIFTGLPAATYPVYVEDANGCLFTQLVDLYVNVLDVNLTKHDVSCYGLADGDFFLSTTDGVPPYTLTGSFLVDPIITDDGLFAFSGQSAGRYDIRIEDSEGRLYIDTVDLQQPDEIVATALITPATCSANTFDGSIALTVSGGAGSFSYAWSNGNTTRDLTGIEAGHYSLTIVDANLCQTVYDFNVAGVYMATAYAGEDDTICAGADYQLFGSLGDSVHWEPAALTDDPDITNPMVNITTTTPFIYTVYDHGCWDRDTVVISLYERIGMDIYDPSGMVEIDTALFLLAGETYTLAATPGFESYLWTPSTWISDPTLQAVVISPQDNIYYYAFGTTADGCIESDMVHVVIAKPIEIFSGFSPNGDGTNDTWVIRHAVEYGSRIRVKVFNRWGEPVFDSKGYGGSNEWDGTRNGKPLPVGAYYYIIDVDDGSSKPYTGTVTIIR